MQKPVKRLSIINYHKRKEVSRTERIKELRLARGIGQAELARRLGVTKAAVLFMEQPGKYPEAARLPKIAKELNCTIDELYDKAPN